MLSLCRDGEYYQFFLSYSVCMGVSRGTLAGYKQVSVN